MAQRRPILHRVLDYSDEGYAALMLLLELHSLRTSGGCIVPTNARIMPVSTIREAWRRSSVHDFVLKNLFTACRCFFFRIVIWLAPNTSNERCCCSTTIGSCCSIWTATLDSQTESPLSTLLGTLQNIKEKLLRYLELQQNECRFTFKWLCSYFISTK